MVSVVIPNHNRADLIGATLENLLRQTAPPAEIIVVDDGSTDQSAEVVRGFAPRVTLVQQERQGPGAARNLGWSRATGEFIQFMDSDDLCSLNKLEVQSRILRESGADLVYGPWIKGHIQDGVFRPENVVLQQRPLPPRLPLQAWVLRGLSIVFQTCLVRRSLLERVGGYRTDLMPSEDAELLFRLGLAGAKLAFSPECLTLYRLHARNQITGSGMMRGERLADWARLLLLLQEQTEAKRVQFDLVTRLIVGAEIWNTRRWMRRLGAMPSDLYERLQRVSANTWAPLCWIVKAGERLAARWRQTRHGHRWKPCYEAGPLTSAQQELIQQLGLRVGH
jgi:glycosyltransferase involved in cell wall biosynthesis